MIISKLENHNQLSGQEKKSILFFHESRNISADNVFQFF